MNDVAPDPVTRMILSEIQGLRGDVKDLNKKVDDKFDGLQARITSENTTLQGRIQAEVMERVRLTERVQGLVSRVNWVYVILGGVATAAIIGFLTLGR